MSDLPNNLNDDEQQTAIVLARRQRDEEQAESRIITRATTRVEAFKQIWVILFGCATAIVFGTTHLLNLQNGVERLSRESTDLQAYARRNESRIVELEKQIRDKADRKYTP